MRSIKCDEIKRSALKEKFINKWDRRGREGSEEGRRKRQRKNIKRGVEGEAGDGCVGLRTVPLNWVSWQIGCSSLENGNHLEQVSNAREYFRYDYFQKGQGQRGRRAG